MLKAPRTDLEQERGEDAVVHQRRDAQPAIDVRREDAQQDVRYRNAQPHENGCGVPQLHDGGRLVQQPAERWHSQLSVCAKAAVKVRAGSTSLLASHSNSYWCSQLVPKDDIPAQQATSDKLRVHAQEQKAAHDANGMEPP